jgi:hypothetical protein
MEKNYSVQPDLAIPSKFLRENMEYAPLKQRNSRKSSSEAITRENLSVKKISWMI